MLCWYYMYTCLSLLVNYQRIPSGELFACDVTGAPLTWNRYCINWDCILMNQQSLLLPLIADER